MPAYIPGADWGVIAIILGSPESVVLKNATNVETDVREGKAFVEIVKKAKEDNIDLIVMGSHGRSGLESILVGSVAEKVTRKAACPVLVVNTKDTEFKMP